MNKTLWIVVAVVVVAGGIWYVSQRGSESPASTSPSTSPVTVKDTTDTSLNADATALDTEMNSVNTDLSSVDMSLSDTPIPQVQ